MTGSNGAFAIMGAVDPESFDTLHSFSNAFEMPFVTPWFPEKNFGKLTVDVHLNCRNKKLLKQSVWFMDTFRIDIPLHVH